MDTALAQLKDHLATIRDLQNTAALLGWDQRTYMPPAGAQTRANQLATVSRIAHELLISDTTGQLIDSVDTEGLDPDSDDARLIDVVIYDYERALKLPSEFVARHSRVRSLANRAWQEARAESNFDHFKPHLEEIVQLVREYAELRGYDEHPYDALLNDYERGLTNAQTAALFTTLREGTLPLLQAIIEQGSDERRDACLHQSFPEPQQEAFGMEIATRFGYDLQRGRQDRTAHPFCINFGRYDVRITTRFNSNWISPALFGTMHETGHALYEQGVKEELHRTPLERGASLGIHESQSRMWENLVGRSRPFWSYFYPRLRTFFPEQLTHVDLDMFYRAINTVQPSLTRVEADEVTYNFHIMVRYELELALLEGKLEVADLPAAWDSKMEQYLNLTPPNDALGVLQDIHWSGGMFGYFPTYTLGNVLSVQFFNQATAQHPQIMDEMAHGEFGTLLGWMRENIHQHGRKFTPAELVQRITGGPIDAQPYVEYLHDKFGALYGLK